MAARNRRRARLRLDGPGGAGHREGDAEKRRLHPEAREL